MADDPVIPAPVATQKHRQGFLPIQTNWFDRLFIGIYLFVAIELFWLRFLEAAIPLTFAHLVALAVGALILWRG